MQQSQKLLNIRELQGLYEQVVLYKKAKPWENMMEGQVFAVEDPETHEVGYCSVTGMMGQHFSLNVYVGEAGKRALYSFFTMEKVPSASPILASQYLLSNAALVCSFEDKELLNPADKEVLQLLDLRFRGKNAWPVCRKFSQGKEPTQIKDGWESRFLAYALARAVEVAKDVKRKKLVIEPIKTAKQMLYLYEETVDGEKISRRSWRAFDFEQQMNHVRPYLFKDEMLLKRIKGLKRRKLVLGCKQYILPVGVKSSKGEVYYPSNMVFYNSKLKEIEHMCIVGDEETDGDFAKRGPELVRQYAQHICQIGERPKEIIVDTEATYQLLADFCKQTGIQLTKGKVSEAINEVIEDMVMTLHMHNGIRGEEYFDPFDALGKDNFEGEDFEMDDFEDEDLDYEELMELAFGEHGKLDKAELEKQMLDLVIGEFIEMTINEFLGAPGKRNWSNRKKDECGNMIAMVIDVLWEIMGEQPGEWTPRSLKKVLTQIIPFGDDIDLKTVELLPDYLSDYLSFLKKLGPLENSKALFETIEDSKISMIENFKSRSLLRTNHNNVIPFKR